LSVAAGRIAVLADENFDWRSFLVRWSEEWADACNADTSRGEQDEEARCALLRLVEPDETPAPGWRLSPSSTAPRISVSASTTT
jgi:hypothetical protein